MSLLGFAETPGFTSKIVDLLTDEQLGKLQIFLCGNPDFGKIIKRGGLG